MYPTFTYSLLIVGKANESISPAKKSMYAKHLKRLKNDWQPYNYLNYAFVPQSLMGIYDEWYGDKVEICV